MYGTGVKDVDRQKTLFARTKQMKMSCFGQVTRHNSLYNTIMQCSDKGGRKRGWQGNCWTDIIKEWTVMTLPEPLTSSWRSLIDSSAL